MTSPDERTARLERAIRLKRAAARSGAPPIPPRPPDRPAMLGELQQSLWLLHRMDPGSPAYNLVSAFRLRGPLEPDRLERALNEVVTRHRLLRSIFRLEADGVRQVVQPPAPLVLPTVTVAPGEAMAAATEEARRPFDLATGPLVRMRLFEEEAGGERLLLLVLHHILADERSLGFLWRQLAQAYRERLPPAPEIQYDDWVDWTRKRSAEGRQEELDYWRRRLDPPPEELDLPFTGPARASAGRRGRYLARAASAAVRQGADRLAAATGATPFMVYAFAFRLLIQRYVAPRQVAFATPVSRRSHPATAEMIGYFLNPVVVAAAVDERRPVLEAVRRFSDDLKEMLARASVPFQVLAEELAPPRRPESHPLFQAMFVHQAVAAPPALGEARLEPVVLDLGESKFDLTLFVGEGEGEGEDSLELAVEYRADRFAAAWMERLLDHYATILERLPQDLERATAQVPMLGDEEEKWLLATARGAELAESSRDLLPTRILEQARRSRDSPALVCGGEGWTYGELLAAAGAIRRSLAAAGVRPGDRVGLFVERSAGMIAGIVGCHLAGAAYVPLDPAYPSRRNRDVLADAEVAAVLTGSAQRDRLSEGDWPVIDLAAASAGDGAAEASADLGPEAVAYLLYTSGSTGRPKGVVVTHGNLRASNQARLEHYDRPPERFLLVPSVAFDSSVAGIFWTLSTGGTLVIPTEEEARDPRLLARLTAEQRVTGLLCVPSLWAGMLDAAADALRDLEWAIVAGESCAPRLVEQHLRRLPGVRLFNEYGPTEATVWATVREMTAEDAEGPVSVGRPIPGVRVEVLDAHGRRLPAGVPGEAWIAGPTVARGYWRRPELSAESFLEPDDGEAGWRRYRTGDRMAWTADGQLRFLGRVDEQIKLRGFRIEPGEIEAALLELPGVERAVVVARPLAVGQAAGSAPGPVGLVAFVQGAPTVTDWRRHLGRRLPDPMIPTRLERLARLPRLPNGKVDRRRLGELPLAPEAGAEGSDEVPSTREQALISLWRGLLGLSTVGLDDNFFELGGHSLLVVEMAAAIERDFEVTLPVAEVFEHPTVRQLARRIGRRGGTASRPYEHLFPIQPSGSGVPFIVAVSHFFTDMFARRFRGERPVYGLRGIGLRPEGNLGRWRTMEELGADLVAEIERRFGDGPCILAGYSFGASMAVEVARQLEARGRAVRRLYLIAPMPLDVYSLGPFRVQIDGLTRPIADLGRGEAWRLWLRGNRPWTLRPYRRLWRRLAIEPWRRLLCLVGKLKVRAGRQLGQRILYADVRVDRFRLHARYRPAGVRAPTVIFNAREPETDAAATWRTCFEGPFSVVETPDPHLDEAEVEAARRVILEHLAELESLGPEAPDPEVPDPEVPDPEDGAC